jgi:hypothetical protein
MLKALLTQEQVNQLLALNKPNIIFVPCGDKTLGGVAISKETFNDPVFADHKALVDEWDNQGLLEWQDVPDYPF